MGIHLLSADQATSLNIRSLKDNYECHFLRSNVLVSVCRKEDVNVGLSLDELILPEAVGSTPGWCRDQRNVKEASIHSMSMDSTEMAMLGNR